MDNQNNKHDTKEQSPLCSRSAPLSTPVAMDRLGVATNRLPVAKNRLGVAKNRLAVTKTHWIPWNHLPTRAFFFVTQVDASMAQPHLQN